MPIPDEFEYEFEFQNGKTDDDDEFTCEMDDSRVLAEHPLPDRSSEEYSQHSPMVLRGSSVL